MRKENEAVDHMSETRGGEGGEGVGMERGGRGGVQETCGMSGHMCTR